jgi:hypothetical protein
MGEQTTWQRGSWMQTYTGHDELNQRADRIEAES